MGQTKPKKAAERGPSPTGPAGCVSAHEAARKQAPEIRRRLLKAYDEGKRSLPWRGESDPYRIWVSEVMLQQTRVDTVIPYYRRWLERFPTIDALAEAEEDEVLRCWQGLGYYSRARRLHNAARFVREQYAGSVPSSAESLRELPGVGEYTAGAVASIAFGEVVPAVDGNVRRVLSRLFDLPDPGAAELRKLSSVLVDPVRPGDFNQAMMELGATVCSPRSPTCAECPLVSICGAFREGTVEKRPLSKPRKAVPEVDVVVVVAVRSKRGGAVDSTCSYGIQFFLCRRPDSGLLAGMWEFPGVETQGERASDLSIVESQGRTVNAFFQDLGLEPVGPFLSLKLVPHQFSHLKVRYHPTLVRVRPKDSGREPAGRWVDLDSLHRLAMPVAQQKIAGLALEAVEGWE